MPKDISSLRRALPNSGAAQPHHIEPLECRCLLSAAANYVPGELLVSFQPGMSRSDVADFYADHGLSQKKNLSGGSSAAAGRPGRLKLVSTPVERSRKLLPELRLDARVRYAEPNYLVESAALSGDPELSRDWGLRNIGQTAGTPDADIDAPEAWAIGAGAGVVVAVIDTGVDYTHPDLAANMWTNPGEVPANKKDDDGNGFVDDYYGYDFASRDGDPIDDNGHGTHVAGTIAMVDGNGVGSAGVSPQARIMAIRTDPGNGHALSDLIAAYDYLIMMKGRGVDVRVTNNSYAGPVFSQIWKDSIDAMGDAGILFVAAAANQAIDNDATPYYPASFDSPHIISVAASDHDDRLASFSNWGATSVDLAAPGLNVWSTVPGGGYDWYGGTSMATPHVAGAAALVWSVFPGLSATEVKGRLLNGVDPIGHIGANGSYLTLTSGRLNVRNAVLLAPDSGDAAAPAAVSNLAAGATSPWSLTLNWTATGDDAAAGRAGFYDVRYSTRPITEANWAATSPAAGEPAPRAAGAAETFTAEGLEPGTLYYFALKVKDNAGNISALSNIAQASTSPAAFLLNDGAEGGAPAWSATGLWHRSPVRGHDSAAAWYFGQDSTRTYFNGTQDNGFLTLASPIDLTGVSQAQLRFSEWRQVMDFAPLDVARVQASRDGIAWTTLSESFQSTLDWAARSADLSAFVGGPLHLRFEFNKNAYGFLPWAINQGYEGWHIDDVQVVVPAAQPPGFSINDVTVTEGHAGSTRATFTVTRSSGSGSASVRYAAADASAVAQGDYQRASGTLSFAPGETRKAVTILVNGDHAGEADESFLVNLSNPSGAVISDGRGRAAILDDEPRVHATGVNIFEARTQSGPIAVNLSAPSSQTVTVGYRTTDGTAKAGEDYLPVSGTLTFSPGETRKVIPITVTKDSEQVPVEAFFVDVTSASGNAVVLRRGVVHLIDEDGINGNHNGYRNRAGAATAVVQPVSGGAPTPLIGAGNSRPLFSTAAVQAIAVFDRPHMKESYILSL